MLWLAPPAYMSPEQARGRTVDKRSDIYSLGVILYELLTGRVPFEGEQLLAIMLKLVNDPPPPPTSLNPQLPPAVEQVVLKAMSKNPDDRYPSAGKMAQALVEAARRTGHDTLPSSHWQVPLTDQDQAGPIESDEALALQQAKIPEIKSVEIPPANAEPDGHFQPGKGGVITISGNTGQIALGGQNVIQFGQVSGGQISVGGASPQLEAHTMPPDHEVVQQAVADLKAQIERVVPERSRPAAAERLAELAEAITAPTPDIDTMAYVNNWFAKNAPQVADGIKHLLTHAAVRRLMTAAGEEPAAEYERRFGSDSG
jgi:hypothetical protein